jgi:uncharacterized protein (TIGR02301 family)
MRLRLPLILAGLVAACLSGGAAFAAFAQQTPPSSLAEASDADPASPGDAKKPSGPTSAQLMELAKSLGEAHAVRTLCNGADDQTWRDYMLQFLEMEAGGGAARSTLTSAFNQGYRQVRTKLAACATDLTATEAEIARRGRALADRIAESYLK